MYFKKRKKSEEMNKFYIYFYHKHTFIRHFPISAADPNNLVNRLIRRYWHPHGVDACFQASLVYGDIDQPVPKPESDVRFRVFTHRNLFVLVFQSFTLDIVERKCNVFSFIR